MCPRVQQRDDVGYRSRHQRQHAGQSTDAWAGRTRNDGLHDRPLKSQNPASPPGAVHLEPHSGARPCRARRHPPPARQPVHDPQAPTTLRLNVQPILKTGRTTSVVGDLDAQPISTRPDSDGHRALTMNHRIGHQFTGQQLSIINLRARPRGQQRMQPVSNSTHRGGLTRQPPDLYAVRPVI